MPVNRKAVFLDRDGVINDVVLRAGRPHPPEDVVAMQILPGVSRALVQLRALGFVNIVVTNQPDIARGKLLAATVQNIHHTMASTLAIDDFRVCPHDDSDSCACRKPKAGLLLDAAREHGIDLTQSFMIGDRWRDVEAGIAAGVRTFYIDRGYSEQKPFVYDWKVESLAEAVRVILNLLDNK